MDILKAALGVGGIIYIISPIDLIPEALLGPFGLVDDAAVGYFSVMMLLDAFGREDIAKETPKGGN